MAELINLRTARKNQQRVEAEKLADANRVKFGRSKVEKKITAVENSRSEKLLDGHKRES
jgi:Domain of unknown function (DUF4169)